MLDLAIIGCGRFVHHYHIPVLRRRGDIRLVGVCDPTPSAETVQLALATEAPLLDSVEDLIDKARPTAVLISSPHGLHAAQIEACLRAGVHVLVDKPFTLNVADASRLARLARESGLVGAVAFNRRFDDGFRYARRVLTNGGIGDLLHVESVQLGYPTGGWYGDPLLGGGGPFVGRGTHMADIVPWVTGLAVQTVTAVLVPPRGPGVDGGGFIVADLGSSSWHATVLAADRWNLDEVRLYGSEGYLVIRRPADQTFNWAAEYRSPTDELMGRSSLGQATAALDDFIAAIVEDRPPSCSFEEAVASVAIIESAYASARSGGQVPPVALRLDNGSPGAASPTYVAKREI